MKKDDRQNDSLTAGFSKCRLCSLIAACAVIGLFALPCTWAQDIARELKVEHRVIRIQENEGLVPNTVIVKRGTTVIWINYAVDPMQIVFGKAVTVACREPINFIMAKSGGYESNAMSRGAVASLCFIEKGTYEYQLERRKGEWSDVDTKRLKGTVKVY